MTHAEAAWSIQRWLDSLPQDAFTCKLWKCWAALCVHTCAGRKENTLYESTVMQREHSVYIQIRVVLVLSSNVGGARGAQWEVQRGVPGGTSPGVMDWKLPRTGWQSITVDGCGLLCVLLRLHSVWQRETTKKYRRHLQARHSTSEERNSVLARNKKWCEKKARRSLSEARQKTASAEHSSTVTVFPPKKLQGAEERREEAKRSEVNEYDDDCFYYFQR